ncbi:MAG: N-acetyltransferase [Anaeromyxobacteraceae bacterium]
MTSRSPEEPPERSARPSRRAGISCDLLLGPDEVSRLVASWLADACVLEARPLSEASLLRLRDFRRIAEELRRVVLGDEDGEGTQEARTFHAAASAGRIQAVAALFACPRATFVEYLLAAPWNLLGPEDPPDLRVVRGAGQALLAKASAWSFARDAGGRVALQAENPRCLSFYARLGFTPIRLADDPFALVPRGRRGWSPEVRRIAAGRSTAEDERSPWLVLEPRRAARSVG